MGLQFRVGPVKFASSYQEEVEAALKKAFGYDAPARSVAAARSLPTQEEQLNGLWDEFMESDEDEDEGTGIQTYIQLMLCVKRALNRNLPLWVVK